jgi:ABC-type multidrug transport system fused ATPase/permease subunit
VLCGASLSSMSGFYVELMKGLGASARLFELRNRQPAIPITGEYMRDVLFTNITVLSGGKLIDDVRKEIRFENVGFSYTERLPIFYDISFCIPVGKITAIVGPSGMGKSTIAHLLLRSVSVCFKISA